jgi:two-component system CheB/CheR fusion protein
MFIVGIGASAGGLKPIEEFFDHMPSDSGMAFVVVQHLSPDFKSLMDELLARHTDMAIHKVVDGVTVEPNSIYLIPPKKSMAIEDGKLRLTDKAINSGLNLPIDVFFRSLARHVGKQSVGIILSGTGSDGSRGIKDINEAGGLVLVQALETVAFDGMPRAAISSGVVDLICTPDKMPEQLINYADTEDRMALQQTEFPSGEEGAPGESAIMKIFRMYRQKYNLDFSLYKPATIKRRIERRMQLAGIQSIDRYVESLSGNIEESENLYRDLLVEVTHFFRDPEGFDQLRNMVIPQLIEEKDEDGEIRVWVAGCATGEEAYSTAILIYDAIQKSGSKRKFKVFATDVHRKSLEIASAGFYPGHALDSVPNDLQHYFVQNNGICNVKREIRQSVIFAANDLTRDPPFTRLDLITCRNVLIYLEPQVQKRVLSMFHFGLRVKGTLFLGPSETVGDLSQEFETVDRHWRIYSKRRDVRLPESTRVPMTPMLGTIISENPAAFVAAPPPAPVSQQAWLTTAYEDLLAKHVPPSLLVDEFHELVHCFGEARKLLSPPEGKPSNDVVKMLEKDLGVAVSAALHRAKAEGIPVTYKGIRVTVAPGDQRLYRVTVEPYRKTDRSLYLISLAESEKIEAVDQVVEDFSFSNESGQQVGQLERELNYTRETLQATVEELESSNEELQATNEELIASNEELQSTNEELHSVNEELYTVNAEHQEKITELTELTVDMDNLLTSTEIGTIFLDKNFAIRMFTPSITAGFNVLDQDIGRSINDIAYKLDNPNLLADTANVLASGEPYESEVQGKGGKIYLQRIQPYRDEGDEVAGIVLTLTDITAIRDAELARSSMQTLTHISQELPDFAYAVSHDFQSPLRHINQYTQILEAAIESGSDSDIKKSSQVIKTSSETMRTMIEGLLSYSRVNTQGTPLEKLDLSIPIYDAVQEMRSALDAMNAEVIVAPGMPAILGDARQLKELFFHLIDNAMKYRSDADPVIKISCDVEEDVATVSVTDNGIGVAERDRERVFTIFKRLGFKEDVPGAGVGLAICRRIVLRHHGLIALVSPADSDTGSTIQFTLRTPMLIKNNTPRQHPKSTQQQEA